MAELLRLGQIMIILTVYSYTHNRVWSQALPGKYECTQFSSRIFSRGSSWLTEYKLPGLCTTMLYQRSLNHQHLPHHSAGAACFIAWVKCELQVNQTLCNV